jgi:hypothetical protein
MQSTWSRLILGLHCNAIRHLTMVLLTFVACGATCMPKRTIPDFQPTPAFNSPPTFEQLVEVLNRTRNVQSLQSNSASVTLNNERAVNTNMTWAREKKFRMTASVAGIAGLDIGSNEEAFWLTIRNFATTPEMYYARHDEFESLVHRPMLPVSPVWLIEALGVIELNPQLVQQAPVTRADGLIEITSWVPSPIGNFARTIVVDPKFGYSRQIVLKDPTGRFVANAQQSKHQYYPSIQASLPHAVKVQLSPAGYEVIELDISIGAYLVNGLPPDNVAQFVMPDRSAFQSYDLARLNQGNHQAIAPPMVAPPQPSYPHNSYRGVPWDGGQSTSNSK